MDAVRRVAVGPAEGLTSFVMQPDVLYEFAPKISCGDEDAAGDQIALNLREP